MFMVCAVVGWKQIEKTAIKTLHNYVHTHSDIKNQLSNTKIKNYQKQVTGWVDDKTT